MLVYNSEIDILNITVSSLNLVGELKTRRWLPTVTTVHRFNHNRAFLLKHKFNWELYVVGNKLMEDCAIIIVNYYLIIYLLSSSSVTSVLAKPSTKTKIIPRAIAAAFSFGPDPLFDPDRPAGVHIVCIIIITIKIYYHL